MVVDSSKEPTRALFFAKHDPDARLIYLVRDPRAVTSSYYWRFKDGWPFHFLRKERNSRYVWPLYMLVASASWLAGNILYELVQRQAPEPDDPRALRGPLHPARHRTRSDRPPPSAWISVTSSR